MEMPRLSVVTGAFGYTGKYITRLLLSRGEGVVTLTGHPDRPNPFGERVRVAPFNFGNWREMVKSMEGATTLFNTYWIRFSYGELTFERAVENSKALVRAAEEAGIQKIVHISIAHASLDSRLPYFRGKAMVEEAIRSSKLSYAILRPTVIFGSEGILINNIAWLLRRFPFFVVPGSGDYRLQPVFVEDLAALAVDAAQRGENLEMDAAGPEVYTFDQLVRLIANNVHRRARIIHLNPRIALALSALIGWMVKDVVLTEDEVKGLMADLLISESAPTGHTRLSDWLEENADTVGIRYASEMSRHYRQMKRGS